MTAPMARIVPFCLLTLFLAAEAAPSSATSYIRGNQGCGDFEDMERLYRADPESVNYQRGYATCLVIKGEDAEGLSRLYHITDRYSDIASAFFIAKYIEYGGRFQLPIDEEKIDESIEAYFRVLFLIDLDPDYPRKYRIYESEEQMELAAHYKVTQLYIDKFAYGVQGLYNQHLLASPSYEGERDLKTYPEYSPYTRDSLKKVIEFSNRCIHLPEKPYFRGDYHTNYKNACRLLKDTAEELLPLEEKRLDLLGLESCAGDLPTCAEYEELDKKAIPIYKQFQSELWDMAESAPYLAN